MDHNEVQLIGVFDPDGKSESFCYTVNAPTNLWMSAQVSDGTRMHPQFMGYILNELIDGDLFEEGCSVSVASQDGASLKATVGVLALASDVEANAAHSQLVRIVTVQAVPA